MGNSKLLWACVSAVTLALAACGGGNAADQPPPASGAGIGSISELEATGLLPRLDRSDSLLGPDANGNGIRDDIDAYIDGLGIQQQNKAAARQLARSSQSVMKLVQAGQLSDPVKVKETKRLGSRAVHCYFSRVDIKTPDNWNVFNALEKMSFNTRARANAYIQYNQALSGTTWTLPEGDTCDE